jgi:hypothetical protein
MTNELDIITNELDSSVFFLGLTECLCNNKRLLCDRLFCLLLLFVRLALRFSGHLINIL